MARVHRLQAFSNAPRPAVSLAHICTFPPQMCIPYPPLKAHLRSAIDLASKCGGGGWLRTDRRLHKRHHRRMALIIHDTYEKEDGSPVRTLPLSQRSIDDPLRFELIDRLDRSTLNGTTNLDITLNAAGTSPRRPGSATTRWAPTPTTPRVAMRWPRQATGGHSPTMPTGTCRPDGARRSATRPTICRAPSRTAR